MKLTTKLLLGATVVAGLSVSAFAACASDVDFGSTDGINGKSITGLKDPTAPQHAATKGYVDNTTIGVHEIYSIPHSAEGDLNITLSSIGGPIRVHIFSYNRKPYNIECSGYAYVPNPQLPSCVVLSDGMSGSVSPVSDKILNVKWNNAWSNGAAWNAKVIRYKY